MWKLRRIAKAVWRPKMPVVVFAGVTLLLGMVLTFLAFGRSDPASTIGGSLAAAPPGYSFVYRYVSDDAGISRSDLPKDWICLSEGVTSPWTSCFAFESSGVTLDQVLSIGTLVVGALSAMATFYVGLRGLQRQNGYPPNEEAK